MSSTLDLGDGHVLRFVEDGQGNRIGAIHEHPWPGNVSLELDSGRCSGSIWFDVPAMRAVEAASPGRVYNKWRIDSAEPLTLSPSLQCRGGCGIHGFIRDGKWVPA